MELYRRVLAYVLRYRWLIAATIGATVGFAIFDAFSMLMLIPFLNQLFGTSPLAIQSGQQHGIQWLLDHTVGAFLDPGAPPQRVLIDVIAVILVVFLAKNVFDFLQQYLAARLEQRVTRHMRNEVYDHLLELDLGFFGRTRAGQIISRLTNDVDQLRMLVTRNIAKLTTSLFQILATLAASLMISFRLTVAAVIVMPAMFGIWGRMLRRLRTGDRRVLDLAGDVSSHLQESVAGIRLVKSFAAEPFESRRFRGLTQRYYRTYVRTEALRSLAGPVTEMMGAFGTVLLLWYGSRMVLVEHALDAATFITFLGLSMKLYAPVKWTSKFPSMIQPGLAAAERIFEFLDAPVRIRDRPDAREFSGEHGAIRFEDVSFRYEPEEPVLKEVSLEVARGEVVALVGPSGAGKTTVVDLLARFYDPVRGRITIDGVDLRDFSLRSLRSSLGIVTQETVLFHDTVRANIAYGRPDASQAAIERAARAAHAHEFVEQLPQRLRHRARRARDAALGRAAAAHRDRPRVAARPADPDLRRGDLRARFGVRAAGAGRDRAAARGAHRLRHRAPPLHHPARRPDPRPARRPHRRARPPRGAARARRRLQPAARAAVRGARRRARRRRVVRVLHVDAGREWRGGQRQALLLALGLARRGVAGLVVAQPGSPLLERARGAGLETRPLRMRGDADVAAAARLAAAARERDAALVHAHDARAHSVAALARLFGSGAAVVVTRRSLVKRSDAFSRAKYRWGAAAHIAVSRAVADGLAGLGVAPSRVSVVPDGVDFSSTPARAEAVDWRARLGLRAADRVLGSVGALSPEKGYDIAVAALAALPADVHLVVLGEGPEAAALRAAAERAGVAQRLHLAGFGDAVPAAIRGFDAYVQPSRAEGLGTAAMEAMAQGVPVVAAAAGGLRELVADGESGLLAPPEDAAALAAACARLLGDAALRQRLAEGARRRIRAYSVDAMVSGTLAVYERLLGRDGRRAVPRRVAGAP